MTKQDQIKLAYGKYYEECNPNPDGWSCSCFKPEELDIVFGEYDSSDFWIPRSILGIENNNNWVNIDTLPSETGHYFIFANSKIIEAKYHGNDSWSIVGSDEVKTAKKLKITHYQQIVYPEKPLY